MNRPQFATIGRIVKSHGVNGEVSFKPEDGLPPSCLEGLKVWIVPPYEAADPYEITDVRPGPKGPLITLAGIDSVEVSSEVAGRSLVARGEDLPPEWHDVEPEIEGYKVTDEERGDLGVIDETIVTGANDVWIVRGERYGEVLIPVIEEVVLDVDDEARTVSVRLLPGLIDEEGSQ